MWGQSPNNKLMWAEYLYKKRELTLPQILKILEIVRLVDFVGQHQEAALIWTGAGVVVGAANLTVRLVGESLE